MVAIPKKMVGQLTETSKYKQKSLCQTIVVVKDLKNNLLSLPAIVALKLAARINVITDYQAMVKESFPTVFQGLGNLGEPYVIQLQPEVQLHEIYVARNVPLSLKNKVRTELHRMEFVGGDF